jgi:hypothetical protein
MTDTLLDRFIETHEGPVLVRDGDHIRGATSLELELRAHLDTLTTAANEVVRFYGTDRTWSLQYRTLLGSRIDDLDAILNGEHR